MPAPRGRVMENEVLEAGRINLDIFKEAINRDHLVTVDFSYVAPKIQAWWLKKADKINLHLAKIELSNLVMKALRPHHFELFHQLGIPPSQIAAVCITGLFAEDDPKLALVVHEAFSELFHLKDITYPYE